MGSNLVKEVHEEGFSDMDGDRPLAAACNGTESESFHRNYKELNRKTKDGNSGKQRPQH
jgi:hypothetical protein